MRHTVRALVGIVLIGLCCCRAMAAEAGSSFWPFGGNRDAASRSASSPSPQAVTAPGMSSSQSVRQAPVPEYATDAESERHWMINSPFAKVSWPRIHLPEMPKPQFWPKKSQVDEARNAWVDRSPTRPEPTPLQAMTDGARRVGESTRTAWRKTVDALTPGERAPSRSSRITRRDNPPFWKRMFVEEPAPQGPQTVTEWMAQERLDP